MASRIAFALADLREEIYKLVPEERWPDGPLVDIVMSPMVFEKVEAEIRDRHNGVHLPSDATYRGPGTRAFRYAGVRLVMMPMR